MQWLIIFWFLYDQCAKHISHGVSSRKIDCVSNWSIFKDLYHEAHLNLNLTLCIRCRVMDNVILKKTLKIVEILGIFYKFQEFWSKNLAFLRVNVHYIERQFFMLFTITRVIYVLKVLFPAKCSLYWEVHYIKYSLYRELTVPSLVN